MSLFGLISIHKNKFIRYKNKINFLFINIHLGLYHFQYSKKRHDLMDVTVHRTRDPYKMCLIGGDFLFSSSIKQSVSDPTLTYQEMC